MGGQGEKADKPWEETELSLLPTYCFVPYIAIVLACLPPSSSLWPPLPPCPCPPVCLACPSSAPPCCTATLPLPWGRGGAWVEGMCVSWWHELTHVSSLLPAHYLLSIRHSLHLGRILPTHRVLGIPVACFGGGGSLLCHRQSVPPVRDLYSLGRCILWSRVDGTTLCRGKE